MPSPKFSEELQPHKHVVAEKSLKCASSQVLRAVTCTFVCWYMCTIAVSCSPLFSLHFFCPGTWKVCASLCMEMVCVIQNVLRCPGLDAEVSGDSQGTGQVHKEQVHAICGAGDSPALPLLLHCILLRCYLYPLLELQHWHC